MSVGHCVPAAQAVPRAIYPARASQHAGLAVTMNGFSVLYQNDLV